MKNSCLNQRSTVIISRGHVYWFSHYLGQKHPVFVRFFRDYNKPSTAINQRIGNGLIAADALASIGRLSSGS
jgi:hypothetical protein